MPKKQTQQYFQPQKKKPTESTNPPKSQRAPLQQEENTNTNISSTSGDEVPINGPQSSGSYTTGTTLMGPWNPASTSLYIGSLSHYL